MEFFISLVQQWCLPLKLFCHIAMHYKRSIN